MSSNVAARAGAAAGLALPYLASGGDTEYSSSSYSTLLQGRTRACSLQLGFVRNCCAESARRISIRNGARDQPQQMGVIDLRTCGAPSADEV